jgi:hypothetical protein
MALGLGLAGALSAALAAQVPDAAWYNTKSNQKANRFEGFYPRKVSAAAAVELISLFRSKESYVAGKRTQLRVRFFSTDPARVTVRARELRPRLFYFMEAKPPAGGWKSGWNEFGPWPVDEVLGTRVASDNLGVLVRVDGRDEGGGEVAPAILYHTAKPGAGTAYQAAFMPGVALAGGKYEVRLACGPGPVTITEPVGRQTGGVYFPVRFALPGDFKGDAELRIEVTSRTDPDGTPAIRRYCFSHEPLD